MNKHPQPIHNNHGHISQLIDGINKKIHKNKQNQEKNHSTAKLCPFPPGLKFTSQSVHPITLRIPLVQLMNKEQHLTETFLWDLEDEQSELKMFTNMFFIVMDLLQEKYPQQVKKLQASSAISIIENCMEQLHTQISQHKEIHQNKCMILESGSLFQCPDNLVNISISIDHIKDSFQWDLDNDYNYIDSFVASYCYENKIDYKYQIELGNQIRDKISKSLDKRLHKLAKIYKDDRHNLKETLMNQLDYPCYEPYAGIKEMPSNPELNNFLKRYIEFLPQDLLIAYGGKPMQKSIGQDMCVDQEDTKKFEKKFKTWSKSIDQAIFQDIIAKQQTITQTI